MKKSPYLIIKNRRVTEKSRVLENLQNAMSNASLKKCKTPRYVFDVDPDASKQEIAQAIEEIYAANQIRVKKVNTMTIKSKTRRVRGFIGRTTGGKKAIVSLQPGQTIEEQV